MIFYEKLFHNIIFMELFKFWLNFFFISLFLSWRWKWGNGWKCACGRGKWILDGNVIKKRYVSGKIKINGKKWKWIKNGNLGKNTIC